MASQYNFKKIQIVPPVSSFLDIVLSKTQRKTPTVIHKCYAISRIRQFYMRKVKFTQETFNERISLIVDYFPNLDSIHPFYADLINVLYDKDHYKLALGQLNIARQLINKVGKDYVKLLKFGDSLYRCKNLKIAALGRMATIVKRQKDTLVYLEQVRQHLSRLPCIDPNMRTLLICGYPNVGKSSFINKITRADVEVQPYAFTTKSLFIGHTDYNYLRWQVIDTPGVLDQPLEHRNTIEMQSITAIAHLRACIMYFMDLSEHCGYTVEAQCKLFHSLKPLFQNKPIILVINKIDLVRYADLNEKDRALIEEIITETKATLLESSTVSDEGIMNVRNIACEKLLKYRVDTKVKGNKIEGVLNKLHLSIPKPRDNMLRLPHIPENALNRVKYEKNDPLRPKTQKDLQEENGGPSNYSADLKEPYILEKEEWKYDKIPEIYNGKNVMDFIDPEIEKKLMELEAEEERYMKDNVYDVKTYKLNDDEKTIMSTFEKVREQKLVKQILKRVKLGANRTNITREHVVKRRGLGEFKTHIESLGIDPTLSIETQKKIKAESTAKNKSKEPKVEYNSDAMETDDVPSTKPQKATKIPRTAPKKDRSMAGLKDEQALRRSNRGIKGFIQKRSASGKIREGDNVVYDLKPKHMFSGKRKQNQVTRR